ncbi:transposase [Streptomyces sp. G3]|uniref:transposase n=1 Tax=unclassified Streptomyces TaxID=2593676 RepID=UPI0020309E13|nr:transposase [Streptomyces sp. G3]MCM1943572.1 transposase [Streptomyces sp. G3]
MRADLVPDDLWDRVAPLLPPSPERRHRHPGRLRVPDRTALAGVLFVLRTGVAWQDVPAETVGCSGVTAWRRIARRGIAHGSGLGKVRWVVERTFAWPHRFKRLRTRYERRADLHPGFLDLACSLIRLRHLRSSF